MTQQTEIIQLHEISIPGFKENYLYFLQLVNNTIGSIFYQYFTRRRSSKSKKRKKNKIVKRNRTNKEQLLINAINNSLPDKKSKDILIEQWRSKKLTFTALLLLNQ